ncbi:MAG: hypothetical protein K8S55_10765 [Phycisphaerae bacterium]|nr:hypothetical protein [Phycisphaerae bacterium]
MSEEAGIIEDDELLYRRVPVQPSYYDPDKGPNPGSRAFHPGEHDETGISVFRANYIRPEQVAQNDRGKRYYIAVLRAGDLRDRGIRVVPKNSGHPPGHAELPDLTYENRRAITVRKAEVLLSQKLCIEILGPLP